MSVSHESLLDDVAVYALGALPSHEARRVRDHLDSCAMCSAEYAALAPAVATIGMSAQACEDQNTGAVTVSPLLKARIMREVRRNTSSRGITRKTTGRTIVWPAYLVAAACFAIALFSTLTNISLTSQLRSAQSQVASVQSRSTSLARNLAEQRFDVTDGQVVRVHHRIYLTFHGIPKPPHGKVYQAWTLAKGSKTMAPSLTFVPDSQGSAVVALPVNADVTSAVAVSVEPEGGSKAPTSKPVVVQSLD